jgi:hypothetical protein
METTKTGGLAAKRILQGNPGGSCREIVWSSRCVFSEQANLKLGIRILACSKARDCRF